MKNNELTQKRHRDARFQNIIENLGHPRAYVRISAFYRLYYYAAKDGQKEKFRNNVFDILCSCLRTMPKETSGSPQKREEYQKERQTLFNILFKDKFRSNKNELILDNVSIDLQKTRLDNMDLTDSNLSGVNLSRADLSRVDLSGADFRNAQLKDANLMEVNSIEKADFSGAKIGDRPITKDDIPADKGEYYADWNSPPKKEEN